MSVPSSLKEEILNILRQSDLDLEAEHAENTLFWTLKLKSSASLALQIAALAHDIERSRPDRYRSEDFSDHAEYKRKHSDKGAEMLTELLEKYDIDRDTVTEAAELVKLHEVGGTEDADVLQDADSISFFDNNLEFYYSYRGLEGTLKQIKYKFERCSTRAQEQIKHLDGYQKFMSLAESNAQHDRMS